MSTVYELSKEHNRVLRVLATAIIKGKRHISTPILRRVLPKEKSIFLAGSHKKNDRWFFEIYNANSEEWMVIITSEAWKSDTYMCISKDGFISTFDNYTCFEPELTEMLNDPDVCEIDIKQTVFKSRKLCRDFFRVKSF